jgi:hypothetical protein
MPKDKKEPTATHERSSSFVSLLTGWAQQGLESFFATQRILVDLAMRQNSGALKTIRRGLSESEAKDSPMKILTEVAVEGSANYIEAQRILLDMAQQENAIITGGIEERVGNYAGAVAMTSVIRRSISTFVEMQQNFLTLASKHTQEWLQSSPDKKTKEATGMAGIAREAMDEFVAAQNKFFDALSEEISARADGKKERAAKKTARTELAILGRQATDSFIDSQKKLLDLAGQQVNVSMQAAGRVLDLKPSARILPMADMAGESVKSFVDAEKALIDSMAKSRTHVKAGSPRPVRPAKRAKAPVKARVKAKVAGTKVRAARAGAEAEV